MKILNLYAGIGGNRKLWGDQHEITAVEQNEEIAAIYAHFFPEDKIIIGDAHKYLLTNFKSYDFIWSSPPCQTHSSVRQNIGVKCQGLAPQYPSMKLYEEILFLKYNFKGLYVVENVRPYYRPLMAAQQIQRHLFWANFSISSRLSFEKDAIRGATIDDLQKHHGFDLISFQLKNKRQALRNCIYPPLGRHIFDAALIKAKQKPILSSSAPQLLLFN